MCMCSYIIYMYIHIYVLCVYICIYMSKTIRSENLDNIILVFLLIKDAFDNIRYICICLQISLYILCLDVKFCNENRIE